MNSGAASLPRRAANAICAHRVDAGALELDQWPRLRGAKKAEGRVERAGLVLGLRRGESSPCSARRVSRELGRPLEKCCRGGDAATALRSAGRAFELGGDVLVGPERSLRSVPSAAIGID